ncbi:MAG: hypothetical protein KBD78_05165 [Oligoflexales bacterium]|nr:hypothetical protein [Oligoflexales bacterium]
MTTFGLRLKFLLTSFLILMVTNCRSTQDKNSACLNSLEAQENLQPKFALLSGTFKFKQATNLNEHLKDGKALTTQDIQRFAMSEIELVRLEGDKKRLLVNVFGSYADYSFYSTEAFKIEFYLPNEKVVMTYDLQSLQKKRIDEFLADKNLKISAATKYSLLSNQYLDHPVTSRTQLAFNKSLDSSDAEKFAELNPYCAHKQAPECLYLMRSKITQFYLEYDDLKDDQKAFLNIAFNKYSKPSLRKMNISSDIYNYQQSWQALLKDLHTFSNFTTHSRFLTLLDKIHVDIKTCKNEDLKEFELDLCKNYDAVVASYGKFIKLETLGSVRNLGLSEFLASLYAYFKTTHDKHPDLKTTLDSLKTLIKNSLKAESTEEDFQAFLKINSTPFSFTAESCLDIYRDPKCVLHAIQVEIDRRIKDKSFKEMTGLQILELYLEEANLAYVERIKSYLETIAAIAQQKRKYETTHNSIISLASYWNPPKQGDTIYSLPLIARLHGAEQSQTIFADFDIRPEDQISLTYEKFFDVQVLANRTASIKLGLEPASIEHGYTFAKNRCEQKTAWVILDDYFPLFAASALAFCEESNGYAYPQLPVGATVDFSDLPEEEPAVAEKANENSQDGIRTVDANNSIQVNRNAQIASSSACEI